MNDDYAYRFEYADESAFEVYADGRAFIVTKSGRREQKFGKIDNRIPLLIGMAAKPRQDEIEGLRSEIERLTKSRDLDAERSPEALEWRRRRKIGMPQ